MNFPRVRARLQTAPDAWRRYRRSSGRRSKRPPTRAIIYDFTYELVRNHNVSDSTYERMIARFGERGVIEGITLATLYSMVGMVYNTVREPVPAGYVPLPDFPQMESIPLKAYADLPPTQPGWTMPPPRPAAPLTPLAQSGRSAAQ